jgi:hypothetical protein
VARFQTDGTSANVQSGSVRVSPAAGNIAPAAIGIFTYRANGVTVSQTGTADQADRSLFVLYGELSGTIRTGLAVANPSASPLAVTISTGGRTASLNVPPNGQRSFFLNEMPEFASLPLPLQGVISVSGSGLLAVTGIRGHTNERGDFLITTTPAVDPLAPVVSSELVFPHFVDGGGYSTQFVLFGASAAGTMYFLTPAGQPKPLLFK